MAVSQETVEKLAEMMRGTRIQRYEDHRKLLREGDSICNYCLTQYHDCCGCEFSPNCDLTSDIQIRNEPNIDLITEEEQEQFRVLQDAVSWAIVELGWEPRWYQIGPLRCSARHMILRSGRQVGKTEILALLALYTAAVHPGRRVVIIGPYQEHVDIIFERIREFITKSELLTDTSFRIRDKMNPHDIVFNHPDGRSSIHGITAGTRTGQKGDKSRGRSPHVLIVDEQDLLDDKTMESMLASLTGTGEIGRIVVSGTPTGRHGLYWKWATNRKLDFKEFHFRSNVSPNWTPELELFYRESYSESSYAHEFDAEFGEEELGVFQHKFIDASLSEYSILNGKPVPGEIYSMGVDWNRKGKGVHIIVVGYDPETQMFCPRLKSIVDPTEFVQLHAINEVVRLNQEWKPEFIYVDQGDGDTQVEALHLHGLHHPGTGLHTKVKGIVFGSKVEIRDPLTKGRIKKPLKPFMVDLCVRRIESGYCILPSSEDTEYGLVGQMRNFRVARWGRDGQKVYADENDHTLVAWMLGVYAIVMELSDIAKVDHTTRVAHTGPLGHGGMADLTSGHKLQEFKERLRRLEPKSRSMITQSVKERMAPIIDSMMRRGHYDLSGISIQDKLKKLNKPGYSSGRRTSWRDSGKPHRSTW